MSNINVDPSSGNAKILSRADSVKRPDMGRVKFSQMTQPYGEGVLQRPLTLLVAWRQLGCDLLN